VLCSLLWVTLLGQGVGLGDPQRSLPTPTMLGSCLVLSWRARAAGAGPAQLLNPGVQTKVRLLPANCEWW